MIVTLACFFVSTFVTNLFATELDVQRGQSPTGAITYVTSGDRTTNKVWLALSARPKELVELCVTDKSYVWITFSPDERWLLMATANGDPLKHNLRLFIREKELHFTEKRDVDLGEELQTVILKESGNAKVSNFKGSIHTTTWSADSAAFLLCVTGEADAGSENLYVNPWFCIYEVATGKIGFDLSKHPFDLKIANEQAVRSVR